MEITHFSDSHNWHFCMCANKCNCVNLSLVWNHFILIHKKDQLFQWWPCLSFWRLLVGFWREFGTFCLHKFFQFLFHEFVPHPTTQCNFLFHEISNTPARQCFSRKALTAALTFHTKPSTHMVQMEWVGFVFTCALCKCSSTRSNKPPWCDSSFSVLVLTQMMVADIFDCPVDVSEEREDDESEDSTWCFFFVWKWRTNKLAKNFRTSTWCISQYSFKDKHVKEKCGQLKTNHANVRST